MPQLFEMANPTAVPRIRRAGPRLALVGLLLFLLAMCLRLSDLPGLNSMRLVLVLLVGTGIIFAGSMRHVEFLQHPTSRWMLAFGVVILLSLPFSYWPGETAGAAIDFGKQLYIYILIINLATSLPALASVSGVMVFSAAVHGGIAIEKFIAMGGGGGEDRRIEGVGGIFGNANDVALSIVAIIPLAWWLATDCPWKFVRWPARLALLVLLGGFVACESRGGFLGLAAAALILALKDRRMRRAVAVAAVVGVIAVFVFPSEKFGRFGTIASYQSDESAQTRLAVWRAAWAMILDHPFCGVGADAFPMAYGKNYLDATVGHAWWVTHNTPLQLAAEIGIGGLVVWILLVASGVVSLRREPNRWLIGDQWARVLRRFQNCLIASLAGYCVAGLFVSRGYDWLLTILLGMAVATQRAFEKLPPVEP